jgi:hypothetical protein
MQARSSLKDYVDFIVHTQIQSEISVGREHRMLIAAIRGWLARHTFIAFRTLIGASPK